MQIRISGHNGTLNQNLVDRSYNYSDLMKAIFLTKYGAADSAFETREVPIPEIGPTEVLIKNSHSGLNFADIVARRGLYPDAPKNPAVLGYDVTGIIESVGADVTDLKVGDRVAALTRFGGYAEYAKTQASGVAVLPPSIPAAEGTVLATQACTAYYAAVHCINLQENDKVLIQAAAGGVGTILTQIAKHKGCQIFGTASGGKLTYMKDNGVDIAIDYTTEQFDERIRKEIGGNELDVVFDSIGGRAFKQGWNLLRPGGTMVNYGAAAQVSGNNKLKSLGVVAGFGLFSPLQLLMSSRSMIAVNMLRIADHKPVLFNKIFQGVMAYTSAGIIKPYLHRVYPAQDLAEAHATLESRKTTGKLVIAW